MSVLYIVATPIGNLKDISLRAIEVLKEVDLILCEDTRVTQKLLNHFNIKTKTLSYHQHSKLKKIDYILKILKEGKNLALVSDAGTPGISDPGNKLISLLVDKSISQKERNFKTYNEAESRAELKNLLTITPLPGPSAITAAASISGIAMDKFLFLGFPPAKKKRRKFFDQIINSKYPVIFYESPHRIIKTLSELQSLVISHKSLVNVVVCRELTKKFETIYRGEIDEVIKEIKKNIIKGEFVVIIEGEK